MSFDPGPLAGVSYRHEADRWTLVFVRRFAHPPEAVWAALTDPAQIAAWAPYTVDPDDDRDDPLAEVTRAEPPSLLEHRWGPDRLRWELVPADGGTELTLRHTTAEADGVSKAAAGWHLCLLVAERLLDGTPIDPIRGMEAMDYGWAELEKAYAERLGVSASGPA